MDKESLKLGGILGGIALCVALLLAIVNALTVDIIAERIKSDEMAALKVVMPAAETFEEIKSDDYIAYKAVKGEEIVGYCIKTAAPGYGGDISLIVGVKDGKVEGVSITEMNETPGLGAKAGEEKFLSQYKGKNGSLTVNKEGGEIEAISGATVTSKAVTSAVNQALEIEKQIKGGEANGN